MIAASTVLLAAIANFNAPDLCKLDESKIVRCKPDAIEWIKDGKATMPIVSAPGKRRYGPRGWMYPPTREAQWLAQVVFEMTGVKPPVIVEAPGKTATNSPAVYIGTSACKRFADAIVPSEPKDKLLHDEAFRVVSEGGSLYFAGMTRHGVADFAERCLGVRDYWEPEKGGRNVIKTKTLLLPDIDYTDRPVFPRREMWPFAHNGWYYTWKAGNSWRIHCDAHQPYSWYRETNFNYRVTRPEIFQLGRDGKRQPPMLCYGNPMTLETYKERLELELAGGPKAGMYNAKTKTLTVSQWDALIDCQCEHCKPLYDESRGTTGNASPIIWGFAKKLADWLHEKHPDLTLTILPYLNTCDIPKGLTFPHGNVEAEVCSMPGLALFKNKDVQTHEEKLIKDWGAVTGRPIRSWHYLCWPAEFCNAPYLFGQTAVDHFKRMRGHVVGSFVNGTGTPPERRVMLSAYVWLRAIWNPDLDVQAVYDVFCRRMFGPAAGPMRKFLAMQEDGWNRQWGAGQISNKNIYEVSYPRKEVIEMEKLLAKARELAKGDELVNKRLDRYTEGFGAFFEESKNLAEGTALEPSLIKKAGSDPILDGKLDDDAWKLAPVYTFVHARNKKNPEPKFKTELRMVWTPNGVTFGFKCHEPAGAGAKNTKTRALEEIELFLDISGTGDGHWYQLFMNETASPLYYTDGPLWQPKGVRNASYFGDGFWSLELFVPFSDLKGFPKAQMPSGTSAEGKFWIGNIMRHRKGKEFSRRYTRFSFWSKDPAAFGKLVFVE